MLILMIFVIGVSAGWAANILTGGAKRPRDWAEVLVAGFAGSFVGGLLISLALGDGLAIRPSGFIGSVTGATIVLFVWRRLRPAGQRR